MDNTLAMTLQPQSLEPTAEDVAMLTRQYQKALNGLYEAYLFGQMLLSVRRRLEDAADARESRIVNRESYALTGDGQTAEPLQIEGSAGESARGPAWNVTPGWNRGTGLKGWLAQYCPEINYSTAKRFLAVAEKTVAALALADEAEASEAAAVGSASPASPESWGEAPCASAGEGARTPFPPEAKVRAFLAGKSQRSILRLGGARPGAGRPRKNWTEALGTSPEAAMKRLEEALAPLNELIVVRQTHRLLSPPMGNNGCYDDTKNKVTYDFSFTINFMNWSYKSGYVEGLSIDRIDSNGNYEPNNCQWITRSENTIKANKTSQHRKANKGTYYGISPSGEKYEFENAAQFGRDHDLNDNRIRQIANSSKGMHKGWRFGFVSELNKESD